MDSGIMVPEGDSGDHISMPFKQAKERTRTAVLELGLFDLKMTHLTGIKSCS